MSFIDRFVQYLGQILDCRIIIWFIVFQLAVHILVKLMRTMNYIDESERKLTCKERWILLGNCLIFKYPETLENRVYGVNKSAETNKNTDSQINYRRYYFAWYPLVLGIIELITYPFLISENKLAAIGIWISFKSAVQIVSWTNKRHVFYAYLLGNIFSIVASGGLYYVLKYFTILK